MCVDFYVSFWWGGDKSGEGKIIDKRGKLLGVLMSLIGVEKIQI